MFICECVPASQHLQDRSMCVHALTCMCNGLYGNLFGITAKNGVQKFYKTVAVKCKGF